VWKDATLSGIASRSIDQKFDAGKSVMDLLDMAKARRVGVEVKRVNVDFPQWMRRPHKGHASRTPADRRTRHPLAPPPRQ
jgi:hypothetical protein